MQYESLVYGCIIDDCCGDSARVACNRAATLALPCAEQWSLLSQEMFTVPQLADAGGSLVVHFGASYRGIEYEWQSWIRQFEQLLTQMYWVSAKVHLDTVLQGSHAFIWQADCAHHTPGSSPLQMRCEWSRDGGI